MGKDFSEAEKKLRKLISNSKFIFEGQSYQAGKADKPKVQGSGGETKTDAYFIAKNHRGNEKEFKISYKKENFSFLENKLTKKNALDLYGPGWSDIIREQISGLEKEFSKRILFYEEKKGRVYPGSICLGWRNEIAIHPRTLCVIPKQDIAERVLSNKNRRSKLRDGTVGGKIIPGSGVPNYFIKMKLEGIKSVNDIFENLKSIEDVVEGLDLYSVFIAHNYDPINDKQHGGDSRSLAVSVDWKTVNGKIEADLIFDKQLEINSNDQADKIKEIIQSVGLKIGQGFARSKFKKKLSPNVITFP